MLLHRGALDGGDQALELALAHAMVRRASAGEIHEAVRIYQPSAPVLVFGRREVRLDRFQEAVQATRDAGFQPAIRATGGRAVAYTRRAVVVDHVAHAVEATGGLDARFEEFGHAFARTLQQLGVDARLGAVPGEYCPGAHSVNARGVVKLVGTAQRVVRNAWLFSSLVMVGDAGVVRPLLRDVYGLLDQELDGNSVGSVSDEVPTLDTDLVERALLDAYRDLGDLRPAPLDEETVALARGLVDQHRVP